MIMLFSKVLCGGALFIYIMKFGMFFWKEISFFSILSAFIWSNVLKNHVLWGWVCCIIMLKTPRVRGVCPSFEMDVSKYILLCKNGSTALWYILVSWPAPRGMNLCSNFRYDMNIYRNVFPCITNDRWE